MLSTFSLFLKLTLSFSNDSVSIPDSNKRRKLLSRAAQNKLSWIFITHVVGTKFIFHFFPQKEIKYDIVNGGGNSC